MELKGYFIQYKFIINSEKTKHSSYTYQKLFRAIYGYTQTISKSSGKTYKYRRNGVLSNTPYVKAGKNCVIVPEGSLKELTNFFKTGNNPTHRWNEKGDWKAVYYMNEKTIDSISAIKAMESLLDRTYVTFKGKKPLFEELKRVLQMEQPNKEFVSIILNESKKITNHNWFRDIVSQSQKLTDFKQKYDLLKSK